MTSPQRERVAEAGAIALVAAHNWLSNRWVPDALYVPASLVATGTLVALGRWGGVSWAGMGLGRARLAPAARAGAAIGGAGAIAVVAAAAAPATRPWFADDRAVALPRRSAVYQTLLRIPVGTALGEEIVFRGVLLGLSLRRWSWPASTAWTSALFGLWHVLPVLDTLPRNRVGRSALEAGRAREAVATAVAGAAVAGAGLAGLRRSTGSVAAPVIVHAAVNVAAFVTARVAHGARRRRA